MIMHWLLWGRQFVEFGTDDYLKSPLYLLIDLIFYIFLGSVIGRTKLGKKRFRIGIAKDLPDYISGNSDTSVNVSEHAELTLALHLVIVRQRPKNAESKVIKAS